jgi:hypothetical protein
MKKIKKLISAIRYLILLPVRTFFFGMGFAFAIVLVIWVTVPDPMSVPDMSNVVSDFSNLLSSMLKG